MMPLDNKFIYTDEDGSYTVTYNISGNNLNISFNPDDEECPSGVTLQFVKQ